MRSIRLPGLGTHLLNSNVNDIACSKNHCMRFVSVHNYSKYYSNKRKKLTHHIIGRFCLIECNDQIANVKEQIEPLLQLRLDEPSKWFDSRIYSIQFFNIF